MDKLTLADPSYSPADYPNLQLPPPLKPKRRKIKPQELMFMDMDQVDSEMSRLNLETPMEAEKRTRFPSFANEVRRRKMEAAKMREPLYDKDGLPILPDGSSRPFTMDEMFRISKEYTTRLCNEKPKAKTPKKKVKLRKNPPPRKVDIEAMFREEVKRREKLDLLN